MDAGIVYLLKNEAMPGYIKIGLTRQNNLEDRLRQLDTTAVPTPFECYFAAHVPDCAKLERTLHFVFGEKRVRRNREFFVIAPDLAKAIIELVASDPIVMTDAEQSIDPEARQEIETLRNRREIRTFTSLNIPMGETLTFAKDTNITCTVCKPRKVLFREDEVSPSAAALTVVREMGYDWARVSGMEYWEWNGTKLSEIGSLAPDRTEDFD